jgi:hypothetical protein
MTIEKFRELLHANPFVPFTIHLADGRNIPVVHQDFFASSQTGRIVCVFHGPADASSFIDIMLVTALELNPGAASTPPANQ